MNQEYLSNFIWQLIINLSSLTPSENNHKYQSLVALIRIGAKDTYKGKQNLYTFDKHPRKDCNREIMANKYNAST